MSRYCYRRSPTDVARCCYNASPIRTATPYPRKPVHATLRANPQAMRATDKIGVDVNSARTIGAIATDRMSLSLITARYLYVVFCDAQARSGIPMLSSGLCKVKTLCGIVNKPSASLKAARKEFHRLSKWFSPVSCDAGCGRQGSRQSGSSIAGG